MNQSDGLTAYIVSLRLLGLGTYHVIVLVYGITNCSSTFRSLDLNPGERLDLEGHSGSDKTLIPPALTLTDPSLCAQMKLVTSQDFGVVRAAWPALPAGSLELAHSSHCQACLVGLPHGARPGWAIAGGQTRCDSISKVGSAYIELQYII